MVVSKGDTRSVEPGEQAMLAACGHGLTCPKVSHAHFGGCRV